MGGHIKDDKALLLRSEDTFLYKVLCDPLTDVAYLITKIEWIPGLAFKKRKGERSYLAKTNIQK